MLRLAVVVKRTFHVKQSPLVGWGGCDLFHVKLSQINESTFHVERGMLLHIVSRGTCCGWDFARALRETKTGPDGSIDRQSPFSVHFEMFMVIFAPFVLSSVLQIAVAPVFRKMESTRSMEL